MKVKSLIIPKTLHEKLKAISDSEGKKFGEYIVRILENFLKGEKK